VPTAARIHQVENIANSIAQLADLFHGLNTLVIDQGALLDRVDYNVEQLNCHVEGAGTELRFAAGHQHSSRKRLCIWLLVFLILGTGLGLFLKQ
jgi:syntaxin 16